MLFERLSNNKIKLSMVGSERDTLIDNIEVTEKLSFDIIRNLSLFSMSLLLLFYIFNLIFISIIIGIILLFFHSMYYHMKNENIVLDLIFNLENYQLRIIHSQGDDIFYLSHPNTKLKIKKDIFYINDTKYILKSSIERKVFFEQLKEATNV